MLEHASYLRSARPSSLCRCNVKAGDGSTQYADIRVEAESCVFYVSRISWKGIRGGDLSGGKKWRLGLILKQHLHGNILSA